MRGPADLWSSVANNIAQIRTADDLAAMPQPNLKQIAALFDNRTEAERLASSISLSLRNMDISVEQIAEFYNEQLVNHMALGKLTGELLSSTLDQALFAHVHSFFVHPGAARDYLAAFCALRLGKILTMSIHFEILQRHYVRSISLPTISSDYSSREAIFRKERTVQLHLN